MLTLNHYLILGAVLFTIGLYGVVSKKNIILVIISVDFMLNAANLNFIAFAKFITPNLNGQLFAIFVMIVTAAEIGVGLGIIIFIYRSKITIENQEFNLMKW